MEGRSWEKGIEVIVCVVRKVEIELIDRIWLKGTRLEVHMCLFGMDKRD